MKILRFKKFILLFIFFSLALGVYAENWESVRNSTEYYSGVGMAESEEDADKEAMSDLLNSIAVHVESSFTQVDDVKMRNGALDHKQNVLSCVKTYAQATLPNTEKFVMRKGHNVSVMRYIRRSELQRVMENRATKARDQIRIADECLEHGKVDMALQYYYWAYSLIRSLQYPEEAKDDNGKALINTIPLKINEILSDIRVRFDSREGDYVDVTFTYRNAPVSSLEFTYNDGRSECTGIAKDGRGMMEMIPGYDTDNYHLNIEYQYLNQARGDAEMESVLNVVTPKVFPKAAMTITGKTSKKDTQTVAATPTVVYTTSPTLAAENAAQTSPTPTVEYATSPALSAENAAQTSATPTAPVVCDTPKLPMVSGIDSKTEIINCIASAIASRRYSEAAKYFTVDGLAMYNRLISYGTARILGTPTVKFSKGLNDRIIARGMQMSFTFQCGKNKKKKTFVEDVSFTFDPTGKIENVAFGLGRLAEQGIMEKECWEMDVRETILGFMENYKTAYSLERIDYIRSIFADDAVIIIGNVAKRAGMKTTATDARISQFGQEQIHYNRYTKDQYLQNLQASFGRNDFINLRFTNHEIQWLDKFENERLFAINIRQEYASSTYSDDGYLFLLVDMTDRDSPQIKVRTWQPNEVSLQKLFNAGDFFSD